MNSLARNLERTCIVSRTVLPTSKMIRFVLSPEGDVVFDSKNNLPGRGVWIERQRSKVQEALKKKTFSKGFKQEVVVSPKLADIIDHILLKDMRQALSLANKAGMVVSGFTKVESAIAGKQLSAIIHAIEAADDGRRKISGALHKRFKSEKLSIPIIDVLPSSELDLALSKANVIHAVVLAGSGSHGFLNCWHHLSDYRGMNAGNSV